MSFEPCFTAVTHAIIADHTWIERALRLLEAATLSEDWIRKMGERMFALDARHTNQIPGRTMTSCDIEL